MDIIVPYPYCYTCSLTSESEVSLGVAIVIMLIAILYKNYVITETNLIIGHPLAMAEQVSK